MKKAFAILACIAILFPSLTKTGVLIWFKANQDYIANVLCINKDNKNRQDCKGCCVLNEKLMAAEELPLAESNHHHQKTETEWQWLIETGVADNIEITSQTNRFSLFISFYTISPVDDIFHPPAQLNQPV